MEKSRGKLRDFLFKENRHKSLMQLETLRKTNYQFNL